jgi:hypothetical protein
MKLPLPGPRMLGAATLAALLLLPLARAADADGVGEVVDPLGGRDGFVFNLLPKSFQRKPTLEMTFNTELTDYGRMLRPASPENPVYYIAEDAGFRQLGWNVGGEKPPAQKDMERIMKKGLATSGFLPAEPPAHPAALAVIYYWGSHNKPDEQTAAMFPLVALRNRLERAILVGGKKFAQGMAFSAEYGPSLTDRLAKQEFLNDQANDEVYFVVASAYDYASLARGQRRLAWRTTMTANSTGVAIAETLPPLLASGAAFFGRETVEPEIGARRISREGRVLIGTPTVVPDPVPDAAKK